MAVLRAAVLFTTQHISISAAAKGMHRSSSFRALANTLARVLTNKDAVSDTITFDSTSSKHPVCQKRELTSFGRKRPTTRAIPSPIKTFDRTSTRMRHDNEECRTGQSTTTPRMYSPIAAVPMTPLPLNPGQPRLRRQVEAHWSDEQQGKSGGMVERRGCRHVRVGLRSKATPITCLQWRHLARQQTLYSGCETDE